MSELQILFVDCLKYHFHFIGGGDLTLKEPFWISYDSECEHPGKLYIYVIPKSRIMYTYIGKCSAWLKKYKQYLVVISLREFSVYSFLRSHHTMSTVQTRVMQRRHWTVLFIANTVSGTSYKDVWNHLSVENSISGPISICPGHVSSNIHFCWRTYWRPLLRTIMTLLSWSKP